jgi:threonine/homoserine/homoserine lactone efflux protein
MLGPPVVFALAMCFTPGPNVVMITASGANSGFRRAVPHMPGISFGFGFGAMATAAGLGLAGLFHAEPRPHAARGRRSPRSAATCLSLVPVFW